MLAISKLLRFSRSGHGHHCVMYVCVLECYDVTVTDVYVSFIILLAS